MANAGCMEPSSTSTSEMSDKENVNTGKSSGINNTPTVLNKRSRDLQNDSIKKSTQKAKNSVENDQTGEKEIQVPLSEPQVENSFMKAIIAAERNLEEREEILKQKWKKLQIDKTKLVKKAKDIYLQKNQYQGWLQEKYKEQEKKKQEAKDSLLDIIIIDIPERNEIEKNDLTNESNANSQQPDKGQIKKEETDKDGSEQSEKILNTKALKENLEKDARDLVAECKSLSERINVLKEKINKKELWTGDDSTRSEQQVQEWQKEESDLLRRKEGIIAQLKLLK